jgi:hypothetical protein
MTNRPPKITFGEMRESGVRGVLIYCADYHCIRAAFSFNSCWRNQTTSFAQAKRRNPNNISRTSWSPHGRSCP